MSSFLYFCDNTRLRYDFDDQIQVRYTHSNGQEYDTWVSGEEVVHRLQSEHAEEMLEGLSNLDKTQLAELKARLPDLGRHAMREYLINRIADELEEFIGGNIIGDNLSDALRNKLTDRPDQPDVAGFWKALLKDETFRLQVMSLAWIQLRGSFPEGGVAAEPDDWI
jgi:hypothetical protein